MAIFPRLIFRFNPVSIKTPTGFSAELVQLILINVEKQGSQKKLWKGKTEDSQLQLLRQYNTGLGTDI
jgi:hypothetical protein